MQEEERRGGRVCERRRSWGKRGGGRGGEVKEV